MATTGELSVALDALARQIAATLGDRIRFRQGKYRFRAHNALGKPITDAAMVAIVSTKLPPMPMLQAELTARILVASDTFKEGLG